MDINWIPQLYRDPVSNRPMPSENPKLSNPKSRKRPKRVRCRKRERYVKNNPKKQKSSSKQPPVERSAVVPQKPLGAEKPQPQQIKSKEKKSPKTNIEPAYKIVESKKIVMIETTTQRGKNIISNWPAYAWATSTACRIGHLSAKCHGSSFPTLSLAKAAAPGPSVPVNTVPRFQHSLPRFEFKLPTEWSSTEDPKSVADKPSRSTEEPKAVMMNRSPASPTNKVESFLSTFQAMEATWKEKQLQSALAAQRKTEMVFSGLQKKTRPQSTSQIKEPSTLKPGKGHSVPGLKATSSFASLEEESHSSHKTRESMMSFPGAVDPSSLDWLYDLAGVKMGRSSCSQDNRYNWSLEEIKPFPVLVSYMC